ncbi:Beta-arabinofuranosyltransferase RAY1 [Sesamum angolense]|uniref:Beta-arabinofuranosyltransferase RAY1 n=1 Tax=Sesamum angolense TaxID=2727404 RepID=A0AAE1X0A6_9LAMI|nr:Beta-arabinofuranosyltransferase RAY1 [Sesamum angolense]
MESRYSLFFSNLYSKKVLQSGLWLVWLCGFFLIGVSFYGTHMLPTFLKEQIKIMKPVVSGVGFDDLSFPKITLFAAPRPFIGSVGERQALAVRSWLGLSENINVVLFSQDPSVFSFADSFGSRVSVETEIDFTFLGTPFYHSMVARALASPSDISALIDPDTILLSNFVSTLIYAYKLDEDWLIVASSGNVSHFPFRLDSDGKSWLADDGKHVTIQKEFLVQKCSWKPCGDRMLIAWNRGDLPLHKGVLPPFLYGKGLHNHWIVTEALISDFRLVIDASLTISSFYIDDLDQENYALISGSTVSDFEKRSWELHGNSLLGRLYGSFSFRDANYSNLFRFFECGGNFLFLNTHKNIAYLLGYKRPLNLRMKGISLSSMQKEILDCVDVIKSLEGIEGCFAKEQMRLPTSISLPLSLESLLSMRADQNKTIAVGVAGHSYKDMLMSWVCRLRHLQVLNFLVCALDDEIYDFSVLQGLPVIKCAYPPTNISFDNCHFGTECFQKVTKVKSRMVLQILKLGYNVLLSDVDVYCFKNPLAYLSSFGPAVLAAQSDEYNVTVPINLPRRLNSGFYYAHSDSITIAALEKVVKHAAKSNLSEQPSFYDTLCGEGGSYRLGDDKCLEPETDLVVHFLNRDLFPNGAYQGLWEEKDIKKACKERGCLVLHNNWISGRRKKLERQCGGEIKGNIPYQQSFGVISGSIEINLKKEVPFAGNVEEMCACFWSGSVLEKESRRKRELSKETISYSESAQLKDITVRVVHAGGRIEMYHSAIPASEMIQKYPGMYIARPDVFKRPHESLLSADDMLLPGHKYFIIRSTTVEKLIRKHSRKGRINENADSDVPILRSDENEDVGDFNSEDSICSARDFFCSKGSWSDDIPENPIEEKGKKPFVPPIQRPRLWKEPEWEPNLTSIRELSP